MVFVVMARYPKAKIRRRRSWDMEHCRDPVPDGAVVTSYGHVEDAGKNIVVKVGRFELKLHHPLAREAWKSCQEGVPLQFKWGRFFKDGAPTWMFHN